MNAELARASCRQNTIYVRPSPCHATAIAGVAAIATVTTIAIDARVNDSSASAADATMAPESTVSRYVASKPYRPRSRCDRDLSTFAGRAASTATPAGSAHAMT